MKERMVKGFAECAKGQKGPYVYCNSMNMSVEIPMSPYLG